MKLPWATDPAEATPHSTAGGGGRIGYLAAGVVIGLAATALDRRSGQRLGNPPASDRPTVAHDRRVDGKGWLRAIGRTWLAFNTDRIPTAAAGVAFFGLLSLFPALGVFVSLYGLFGDPDAARQLIGGLNQVLPGGAVLVLDDQITRLAAAPHMSLGLTFAATLAATLWSSNAGAKALIAGLNTAYGEKERRKFIALNLLSLAFTVGAVMLALVGMAAVMAVPDTLAFLHLEHLQGVSLLRWPALLGITVVTLSVLYRYGPSREQARSRWGAPGGIVAALGWLAMSLTFSLYVANFGHYDRTYGSLGAVVGFMTWLWLSLVVVLFGAELNAELEREISPDGAIGAP